jgi:hypothetical protein
VAHGPLVPIVTPPDPLGPWCEQFWIYIMSQSFHVNMTYSGSVVLEKIFKWPHPICAITCVSSISRGPGPLFELGFPLPKDYLYQVWLKLSCLFWIFFQYKHMQIWFSLLWLHPTPGAPWSEQIWIYMISESIHVQVNMTYSGWVVLEISKLPHPIIAFL